MQGIGIGRSCHVPRLLISNETDKLRLDYLALAKKTPCLNASITCIYNLKYEQACRLSRQMEADSSTLTRHFPAHSS
jgi:hypothetical protein